MAAFPVVPADVEAAPATGLVVVVVAAAVVVVAAAAAAGAAAANEGQGRRILPASLWSRLTKMNSLKKGRGQKYWSQPKHNRARRVDGEKERGDEEKKGENWERRGVKEEGGRGSYVEGRMERLLIVMV